MRDREREREMGNENGQKEISLKGIRTLSILLTVQVNNYDNSEKFITI